MQRRLSPEDRKKFVKLRRAFNSPVIGITGNVGKTTTLEMIVTVLELDGKILKSRSAHGNWQNNITTLNKLSPQYDYALFEFDFNRVNNFGEVLRLIKPNIGIVTNIGDAHLSYLGGMLDIALQKSEVVKYLARDGTAILNKDDELSSHITKHITTKNIIRFGLSQSAEYFASDIEHLGPLGTRFKLNNKYTVTLPVYSLSDIYNFLAATAALVAIDFSIEKIVDVFQSNFILPMGRGRLYSFNGCYVIDECHSATQRSVAKATRTLAGFRPFVDKLIFIVGDMQESGPNAEEIHLNMGYFISALPIDLVITVGHYAEYIGKGVSLIKSAEKVVVSCNSIDEIIKTLETVKNNKAAITVQGIGQVGLRRLLKYLA